MWTKFHLEKKNLPKLLMGHEDVAISTKHSALNSDSYHDINTIVICGNTYYCYLWKQVHMYYCYFSQHKGKSQKKWAGPEELWNDKKQQQAALEHQKQRSERGIE